MELFEDKTKLVKICAPMVRQSRLPFRLLVKEYGCDLTFTPMIIAESFVKSDKCREAEFSTCEDDEPLIVQLAANDPVYFAESTELLYRDCNGVDLNCGCPQRWATQDRLGSCLMKSPELVADILRQTRNRISDPAFSVSAKIRVFEDVEKTVDLARQLEAAGISFLTVHGRTAKEKCQPPRFDTIKTIADSLAIPVVANGSIDSLEIAYKVQELAGVRGVMSARGILENPGLFAGHQKTPVSAIRRWIEINESHFSSLKPHSHFILFHRHLMYMTESLFTKEERKCFNELRTQEAVLEMLNEKFQLGIPIREVDEPL